MPAEFLHLQVNIAGISKIFSNVKYYYHILYIPWSYSKEFKIITCEKIIIQIIAPPSHVV